MAPGSAAYFASSLTRWSLANHQPAGPSGVPSSFDYTYYEDDPFFRPIHAQAVQHVRNHGGLSVTRPGTLGNFEPDFDTRAGGIFLHGA